MSKAEVEAILGKPTECSGALGMSSCTWGDEKAFISVQYAADKALLFSGQGLAIGLPIRVLCTLWLGLLLVGCAGSPKNPPATEQVDLQRYQGTWYELARLPMFFQRNCAQSEAHYRLQEDQSIQVINRCLTLDGDWEQVEAGGRPAAGSHRQVVGALRQLVRQSLPQRGARRLLGAGGGRRLPYRAGGQSEP